MSKNFQLRVSREWEEQLDATIRSLPPTSASHMASSSKESEPPSRASYVRETIEMENLLWRRSPYVAESAFYFVQVTSTGDFAVLRREDLLLNDDLQGIPAHVEIRHEKRPHKPDPWKFCVFSLRSTGPPRVEAAPPGTVSRSHWFKGPFPEGARLQREGCFYLEDYLERARAEQGLTTPADLYDHVDIEIDIPTRRLEILVVVDQRLFDRDDLLQGRPALRFDIRNRDGVPFSSADALDHFLRQRGLTRIGSNYPPEGKRDELYEATVRTAALWSGEYARVLRSLEDDETLPRETTAQIARIRTATELPERYLFYGVSWVGAHIGLTCAVKIPKPRT